MHAIKRVVFYARYSTDQHNPDQLIATSSLTFLFVALPI